MKYVVFLDTSTTPATPLDVIAESEIARIEEKSRDRRTSFERDQLVAWNAKVNGSRGDDRYAEVVEAINVADATAKAVAQEMADRPKDEEC